MAMCKKYLHANTNLVVAICPFCRFYETYVLWPLLLRYKSWNKDMHFTLCIFTHWSRWPMSHVTAFNKWQCDNRLHSSQQMFFFPMSKWRRMPGEQYDQLLWLQKWWDFLCKFCELYVSRLQRYIIYYFYTVKKP